MSSAFTAMPRASLLSVAVFAARIPVFSAVAVKTQTTGCDADTGNAQHTANAHAMTTAIGG